MLRKRKAKRDSGTRSRVSKGPARDAKHLEKVRAQPCMVCGERFDGIRMLTVIHAHHVRELLPRTMGRRISDHFTVPLCEGHHSDQSPLWSLHKENNVGWWHAYGFDSADVFNWIASFSTEGKTAIKALTKAKK